MVVGSMVGAGVFSLPRRFAQETRVAGALAWVIAGTEMLMLAFVFQRLAIRKPDLDAGVYAYAKRDSGNSPASSPPRLSPARQRTVDLEMGKSNPSPPGVRSTR